MKQILIRYFYSPNCPEAFATLDRLDTIFMKINNQVIFESYNTFVDQFSSIHEYYPKEKEIIDVVRGNGDGLLLYGKLFVEGKEIGGFPPSQSKLIEELKKLNIILEDSDFKQETVFSYQNEGNNIIFNINNLSFKQYNEDNLNDSCLLCTKYHPYLQNEDYNNSYWGKYEKYKKNFLLINLCNKDVIGFIAYYDNQPIGFIEAFPLKISRKLGFPVNVDNNEIMISCLSIRKEYSGYGIASQLIDRVENEAKSRNFKAIEVLTFPDQHQWQPQSLYQKLGFIKSINANGLCFYRKNIQ